MNWQKIDKPEILDEIKKVSEKNPVLIFKHSVTCGISATVLARLERHWKDEKTTILPYYLDLIRFRDISNQIVSVFGVRHESPQALLIRNGKCVFDASHYDIDFEELVKI